MFDAVRNNKRIVQIFLGLITLPFAFWGIDSYVRNTAGDQTVATIGRDIKISQQQFQQELRDRQERYRAQMGPLFDAKMLEMPEVRRGILDEMINQRLLLLEANKNRVAAGDEALRKAIVAIPSFSEGGKFSSERYESLLKMQGMTPSMFETQLRQELTLQQLAGTVGRSTIVPQSVNERTLALQAERREVLEAVFATEAFLPQVTLAEDAVKKFYDANPKLFEIPEQARAEYVVLSQDAIASQVTVSEGEIKAWYDSHKERYGTPEERRASHILVKFDEKDKAKSRAKAEELLKEVQKSPAAFGELAKKNSNDPGSAEKGGDLGFFGRGAMVKPFEDAVFKMKEGDISGVVESDFGFHIIKVTGIRAAKEKPLAEVRSEIETELKRAAATRKFAEAVEAFRNTVYEQSDSLKPAAEKYNLPVQQSGWLVRDTKAANGPFSNEALLKQLFSQDSVKNKRNTEAVEVAPNTMVSARILDYKPAAMQPFESVKAQIENRLKRQEADALARKAGEERLAALKKGADEKVSWSGPKWVSRIDPGKTSLPAVAAIFKADATKLPSYAGTELPGNGFAIYKIAKVEVGGKVDDERRKAMVDQLNVMAAQEEMQAYLAALRARYKVDINQAALEAKEK